MNTSDANFSTKRRFRIGRGFTMVEILVALVIGMISMLVVLQTFSASEGLRRTTTGGDDAQMAGAIGLFDIERDLAQAGYGMSTSGIIGCSLTLTAAGGGQTVTLAPVTINPSTAIIPAGDNNTDTLLIAYGNPIAATEGDLITAQATNPNVYTMQSATGWYKNDYVTAMQTPPVSPANAANCAGATLDKITAVPTSGSTNVTVATGVAGISPNSYILYDLGQVPVIVGYAVRNGSLTSCNYIVANCSNTANWSEVAGNISSMRVLYGHDDNSGTMNAIVDTWDQATPTTTCGWLRTSALSLVLVARNSEFSTTTLTSASPTWAEPAWSSGKMYWNGSLATSVTIDLSANVGLAGGATWQNYRYKMYSTVVPLHNVSETGVVPQC